MIKGESQQEPVASHPKRQASSKAKPLTLARAKALVQNGKREEALGLLLIDYTFSRANSPERKRALKIFQTLFEPKPKKKS